MSVTVFSTVRRAPVSRNVALRIVRRTLEALHAPEASVSLHLIGDDRMRALNHAHRGLNRPTDVLSFSLVDHGSPPPRGDWGDIFVDIPYLERQAKRFGVTPREECARMIIHGVLHLSGHDHVHEGDAKKMFGLQEKLVRYFFPL